MTALPSSGVAIELPAHHRIQISDSLRIVARALHETIDQALEQLHRLSFVPVGTELSDRPALADLRLTIRKIGGVFELARAHTPAAVLGLAATLCEQLANMRSEKALAVIERCLWAHHDYLDALSDKSGDNASWDLPLYVIHQQLASLLAPIEAAPSTEAPRAPDGAAGFAAALQALLLDEGIAETDAALCAMVQACEFAVAHAISDEHAHFLKEVGIWLQDMRQGLQPLNRDAVELLQGISDALFVEHSPTSLHLADDVSVLTLFGQRLAALRILFRDAPGRVVRQEDPQILVRLMLQVDHVLTAWNGLMDGQEQQGHDASHSNRLVWEWQRQLWSAASIAKRCWPRLRGTGMSGFLIQLARLAKPLASMQQRDWRNREVSCCLIFVEECLRKRTYLDDGFLEQTDCILDHLVTLSLAEPGSHEESFPWFSRELRADMARRMEGVVERGLQASLKEIERSLTSLWSVSGIDAMRMVAGMTTSGRTTASLHVTPALVMADLNAELLQIESCVAPLQSTEMHTLAHQLRKLIGEKLEVTLQFGFSSVDSPEKQRSEAARARMVRDVVRLGQLLEQSRRSPRNRWHMPRVAKARDEKVSAQDIRHALVLADELSSPQETVAGDGLQWVSVADLLGDAAGTWQPTAPDAEMMQIFLLETRQLLSLLAELLPQMSAAQSDQTRLTEARRCFHTFKGSGKMVGLDAFSDAASATEGLVNACLAAGREIHPYVPPPFLAPFLEKMLALLTCWVGELEAQGGSARHAPSAVSLARQLRGTIHIPAVAVDTDDMPVTDAVVAPVVPIRAHQESLASNLVAGNPAPSEQDPALKEIYLGEVRQVFKTLRQHGSSWRAKVNSGLVVGPPPLYLRAVHTLNGCSGTTGFGEMHQLAGALDRLLECITASGKGLNAAQLSVVEEAVVAMAEMQNAFERNQPVVSQRPIQLSLEALAQHFSGNEMPALPSPPVEVPHEVPAPSPALRQQEVLPDELDHQLLPVFLEEGQDLMTLVGDGLHRYQRDPSQQAVLVELQRPLHTLKGSARMAGALRLGQRMHELESGIQRLLAGADDGVEPLLGVYDQAVRLFEILEQAESQAVTGAPMPATISGPASSTAVMAAVQKPVSSMVRVKAEVLDTLLNQVGEVSIARSQLENEVESLQQVARELAGNIEKLSAQLRDVEIQAEIQIAASTQASQDQAQFDPLELDRFTHLQELTRMMAESVSDVASLQKLLMESARSTQDGLLRQGRLTRELQQELIYTRMVKFRSVEQRFVHLVWQMGKETGKPLHLELVGAEVELDRSILEKMLGPLEHLLRNAAVHGIELPAYRHESGKPPIGRLRVEARQEGNEVIISVGDDGRGLDIQAIREKALALALLSPDQLGDEVRIADMIFEPGLSTSSTVSALAGRGIGMDVVRAEVTALGGRITVATQSGQGAIFTVHLPISLAVTQVTLVKLGTQTYAIPSMLVDKVVQLSGETMRDALANGTMEDGNKRVVLHSLGGLLDVPQQEAQLPPTSMYVLFIKGSNDLVAVSVDHVVGSREVVTKKVGPQLGTLVGVAGATVLGNGDIALIVNPLLLARRLNYRQASYALPELPLAEKKVVMVVDDSLTVRKVTERLLSREGYLVVTAADGFDAIRQLHDVTPDIFLVDIEMPRMDGFTLVRHLRDNAFTREKPIIVITSRTGEKHRMRAHELGVDHYIGKPYQDDQLLAMIKSLTLQA